MALVCMSHGKGDMQAWRDAHITYREVNSKIHHTWVLA